MKKKLLIIIVLLAFIPTSVCGQSESAVAREATFLATSLPSAVIRNWKNTESISAHRAKGGVRFVRTPFAMQCAATGAVSAPARITDSVTVPGLTIHDMRVVDDLVCFCGYYLDTTIHPQPLDKAIIGYFKISELDGPNVYLEFIVFDSLRNLTRMVAYESTAGVKVVAIGTYRDQTTWPVSYKSTMVECDIPSVSTAQIVVDNTDVLHDIILANNYVVAVGYDWTNNNQIILHRVHKDSVPTGLLAVDQRYFTATEEVNNVMRATYLDDNNMAITYLHYDYSTGQFLFRLRVINVNTRIIWNSQEFQTFSKDDPIEMAYDSIADILTVMHPMPFNDHTHSYNYTYFVQMQPYATGSYTANVLIPDGSTYSSLDIFDKQYYVAVGGTHWYYQHTVAPQPNVNDCPKVETLKIRNIANLNYNPFLYFTPILQPLNIISTNKPVLQTDLILNCKDK